MAGTTWQFPERGFSLMRAELGSIFLVAFLVFVFTYFQLGNISSAFLFSSIFIGIYLIVSYIIQLIRQTKEVYALRQGYLEIVRKTRFSQQKEKVSLQRVKHHKLDRLLLGGYLLTEKQKHLLFFNTKQELDKFERILRKYFPV